MNNQQFLASIDVIDPETRQRCLTAMEKYGDNHWWEEGVDLRTFAYYQLNEPIFLSNDFSRFHEGVELLLGRPVWTHEFGINADELRKEAARAWTNGGITDEKERQAAAVKAIDGLLDYAKANDKQVILIQMPDEKVSE